MNNGDVSVLITKARIKQIEIVFGDKPLFQLSVSLITPTDKEISTVTLGDQGWFGKNRTVIIPEKTKRLAMELLDSLHLPVTGKLNEFHSQLSDPVDVEVEK